MYEFTILMFMIIYLVVVSEINGKANYKLMKENKKLRRIINEINENIKDEGM